MASKILLARPRRPKTDEMIELLLARNEITLKHLSLRSTTEGGSTALLAQESISNHLGPDAERRTPGPYDSTKAALKDGTNGESDMCNRAQIKGGSQSQKSDGEREKKRVVADVSPTKLPE